MTVAVPNINDITQNSCNLFYSLLGLLGIERNKDSLTRGQLHKRKITVNYKKKRNMK